MVLVPFSLYIALIYHPSSSSMDDNAKFNGFLTDFCIEKQVLIMGDFNLPDINWTLPQSQFLHHSMLPQLFLVTFNQLGLIQWVNHPTFLPSGNILDYVLTNEDDRLEGSDVFTPSPVVIFDYDLAGLDFLHNTVMQVTEGGQL